LLVFVDIHSPVVVKNVEAASNHYVKVRRLEHKEVLVLILEDELVDEWILLEPLKFFGQLILVKVTTAVVKNLECRISLSFIVSEQKVP
jgi:hypothetical protein